ncbi:MAG TPA: hypothetical protein VEK34_15315 [Methylocella sp.]|nr:hypothetical protein [Methylocella sp.]
MDVLSFRILVAIAATVAPCLLATACPAPAIHFAPAENLERIDVELIEAARHEIDLAAFMLTDWPILQALGGAADRGRGLQTQLR